MARRIQDGSSVELSRAAVLFSEGSWTEGDRLYYEIGRGLADDGELCDLWNRVTETHVRELLFVEQTDLGLERSADYLEVARTHSRPDLADLKGVDVATCYAHQREWVSCRKMLATLDFPNDLRPLEYQAQIDRLSAYCVYYLDNDKEASERLLQRSEQLFNEAGNLDGAGLIASDLCNIGVLEGEAWAIEQVLAAARTETVGDVMQRAIAFQRTGRYEHALKVIDDGLRQFRQASAEQKFELTLRRGTLLTLLADTAAVVQIGPELCDLAEETRSPASNLNRVERLFGELQTRPIESLSVDPNSVENLIAVHEQLVDAHESTLTTEAQARTIVNKLRHAFEKDSVLASSNLLELYRNLVLGEASALLMRLASCASDQETFKTHATECFTEAVKIAIESKRFELSAGYARRLGDLEAFVENDAKASHYWAVAYEQDRLLAQLLITDKSRIQFLAASPDVHDQLIDIAYKRFEDSQHPGDVPLTAASVVARLEAARGSAILGAIMPSAHDVNESIPMPDDLEACWNWYQRTTDPFSVDEAAWLIHQSPEAVYHAMVARDYLGVLKVPATRHMLHRLSSNIVPANVAEVDARIRNDDGLVQRNLAYLSEVLELPALFEELPPRIERLRIVASGELSRVTFAALPVDAHSTMLVERYAISELPCLSALPSLRVRARSQRGLRLGSTLTESQLSSEARADMRDWSGALPTPDKLQKDLSVEHLQQYRIHCHGTHDAESPERSFLQLKPGKKSNGRFYAEELATCNLSHLGILILGACESGMAQERGRSEQIGFVRAGLLAGVSSVVSARFAVKDEDAQRILFDFDKALRTGTKDVALQQAILKFLQSNVTDPEGSDTFPHPYRWASWSLCGDNGYQTRRGPVRRYFTEKAVS